MLNHIHRWIAFVVLSLSFFLPAQVFAKKQTVKAGGHSHLKKKSRKTVKKHRAAKKHHALHKSTRSGHLHHMRLDHRKNRHLHKVHRMEQQHHFKHLIRERADSVDYVDPSLKEKIQGDTGTLTQEGKASYYGHHDGFHGRKMANGRRFNAYGNTIAHPTLPLGTKVLVTNQETGKSVVATVTDRGGFVKYGRIVDVSYGIAKKLGFVTEGTCNVKVKVI